MNGPRPVVGRGRLRVKTVGCSRPPESPMVSSPTRVAGSRVSGDRVSIRPGRWGREMKRKSQAPESSPCCEMMRSQLDWKCDQHTDPAECPDALIVHVGKTKKTLGLLIHDGGSSFIAINYCPWCGTEQLK